MANNKLNKKKENGGTIVVIIIFAIVIIFAVIFGSFYKTTNNTGTGYLSLEPIDVTIFSENTSENHAIHLKVKLEMEEKHLKKINTNNVEYIITEELKSLDYNSIIEKDGMEYLKEQILKALSEKYEGIKEIYLEDFTTDVNIPDTNPPKNNSNNRTDYLKGLKWSK